MSKRLWIGKPGENLYERFFKVTTIGIWMTLGTPDGLVGVPRIGESAYVWARVYNRTEQDVQKAEVSFWFSPPGARLRRSACIFLGKSFVDIAAHQDFEDVLCVSAWTPQFDRAIHGCLVAQINHWLDPLPEEEIFKAYQYTQIGQRNIDLQKLPTGPSEWQASFDVPSAEGEPSNLSINIVTERPPDFDALVHSLGLPSSTVFANDEAIAVGLSETPMGARKRSLSVRAPKGETSTVFISATANRRVANAIQLVEVKEVAGNNMIGGLLYVFRLPG
jgi:hypothetical protein